MRVWTLDRDGATAKRPAVFRNRMDADSPTRGFGPRRRPANSLLHFRHTYSSPVEVLVSGALMPLFPSPAWAFGKAVRSKTKIISLTSGFFPWVSLSCLFFHTNLVGFSFVFIFVLSQPTKTAVWNEGVGISIPRLGVLLGVLLTATGAKQYKQTSRVC